MQLSRKTLRYGALPDLYSFYRLACDEWHVEEGEAVRLPGSQDVAACTLVLRRVPRNLSRWHRAVQRGPE
jgi:hypothetical protein